MAADRTKNGNGSAATRSAVTNGVRLVMNADGRSATARRFRDVFQEIASDLGGADHISEGERQLARRAAALSTYCEQLEASLANGEDVDADTWVRVTNALVRVYGAIGLERRQRPAQTPDPLTYARTVNGEDAA